MTARSISRSAARALMLIFMAAFFPVTVQAGGLSLSDLYDQTQPSVVVLNTKKTVYTTTSAVDEDAPVKFLTTVESGSGVMLSNELILTAAHVVEAGDAVEVTFSDGSTRDAKIVVAYPQADLALVKLVSPYASAKIARIGDSDKIRIGEQIYVVGAPHGLSRTLTRGIVSGRRAPGEADSEFDIVDFLQTDAAVNTGNSGGPMFNMQGEVIGIMSFIRSVSGGSEGLGFAVSINGAIDILLNKPPVYSGLEFVIVQGPLAEALNVPQEKAALIQRVAKNTFGERIGLVGGLVEAHIDEKDYLLGGDILLEVAGVKTSEEQMQMKIQQSLFKLKHGDEVRMRVLRKSRILELSAKIEWQPSYQKLLERFREDR